MTTLSAPFIPENAPFSTEQRSWLNGFLAGLYSNHGDLDSGSGQSQETRPITILWGSQTGNSEGLARKVSKTLGGNGFAPAVFDMGDYDFAKLSEEEVLLVITSTYGEGEPPDNAAAFYDWIMSDSAPKLEKLKYSVLALGDKNYPDFCKCGIEIDQRLGALGAECLTPRVDCDVDFEEPFGKWLSAVQTAAGAASVAESAEDDEGEPQSEYGKHNPFPAKLISNAVLNGEGSSKETRHVEISLEGSGLSYEPGDALAVKPMNTPHLVDELIAAAGFEPHELAPAPHGDDLPLYDALLEHYDITVLTSAFVLACARLSKSAELKELVKDEEKLSAYLVGRQMIDPIVEFGVVFPTTEYLVAPLKQLQPRLYSISSSPKAHQDEVHLTVGVVRYDSHGRLRKGVCSNFLADHDGSQPIRIYFHPTKTFKLPEDADTPVIMVGPGTGIAPFRAFLEERSATGAKGSNWLFFGDQHASCDFLYREELEAYQESGLLTRLDTAFSRDQEKKVYVQDRMKESGEELFKWLESGARFYVCGDASRMAKDVDRALHEIIAEHGGKSSDEAKAYVDALKKEKRYLRDVY
ncbi:sulfite reductase subunit alpha [Pelagicoccus sp. SDUM812003]|uniref:sulfite reductase subunit alpha n=1 Tax=Pelagicoccus sp. SDUM812003 TaxID=3041267 RepID=UPI00280F0E0D|nr:sulfite reductase subunit alpha [Pelagicoccus sp. SDUM812003]MDQ8203785.1 sulfite reductase subunit alpha [Pelagicoccus sp. SDUM812003]